MTYDELRIKIATLKGWTEINDPVDGEAKRPNGEYAYSGVIPNWPGDISAAWELVEEMIANRKRPKIDRVAESEWRVSVDHNYCVVYDESPARAICLAYIAWKEGSSTR